MLEDRVEATNIELKQKLKEIEAQIFVDGCTLGEVKWQQAELCKLENRMKADEKRTYRRGNQENPSRRNPTRADTTIATEKMLETRRDIGRLNDKAKKLEDRVEAAKQERKAIEVKLNKALALAPRIDELADKFDAQRKIQADTDRAIMADVANLNANVRPAIKARLKQHELYLSTLNTYYQNLYLAMSNLAYNSTDSSSNDHLSRTSSELKQIAAF